MGEAQALFPESLKSGERNIMKNSDYSQFALDQKREEEYLGTYKYELPKSYPAGIINTCTEPKKQSGSIKLNIDAEKLKSGKPT